jgi:porphobilinogen synthase
MLIKKRPRRNRKMSALRDLIQDTHLSMNDLLLPCFVISGSKEIQNVESLPGVCRYTSDELIKYLEVFVACGLKGILLFFVINDEDKDANASVALNESFWGYEVINEIKKKYPNLCVMSDLALDPFTLCGHDGLVDQEKILNDESVNVMGKIALLMSEAGADFIAPSDMMDGRIGVFRDLLDRHGYQDVGLLSYTAKYASNFYGPFRDVMGSHPSFGDKKTYQLNPANYREARREAFLDEQEGADILLVKPALPYLDIVAQLRKDTDLPIAAYHVSGEYAMCVAAGERGWLDTKQVLLESLMSIKRAGADIIFTYGISQVMDEIS